MPRQPSPDQLSSALGWASVALGVPQVLRPAGFLRTIGIRPSAASRTWTMAVGARELGAAAGLLALERPRPWRSAWARVAGDGMDVALLTAALRRGTDDSARTGAALAAVLGIAAADFMTGVRLHRARHGEQDETMRVKALITTISPRDNVERAWQNSDEIAALRELGRVDVTFTPAPGDRGTEIQVVVDATASGGKAGAMVKKLVGTSPRQQAYDRLRRFKQVLETGEVARSDGTPQGHTATMQPKQRPAQPVEQSTP